MLYSQQLRILRSSSSSKSRSLPGRTAVLFLSRPMASEARNQSPRASSTVDFLEKWCRIAFRTLSSTFEFDHPGIGERDTRHREVQLPVLRWHRWEVTTGPPGIASYELLKLVSGNFMSSQLMDNSRCILSTILTSFLMNLLYCFHLLVFLSAFRTAKSPIFLRIWGGRAKIFDLFS